MNENNSNLGSTENAVNDELLARIASADPADSFDAGQLKATLADDAVARAAAAPAQGFVGRQATRLAAKFADTYQSRPRFVLGSSLGAVAGVAAFAVVGSIALGGPSAHTVTPLFSVAGGGAGRADSLTSGAEDSKVGSNAIAPGASDMMMPFVSYHFTADASLSGQTGTSHIYQIVAVEDPKAELQKLADALDVKGKLHKGEFSTLTTMPNESMNLDEVDGKSSLTLQDKSWWLGVWQGDFKGDMTCVGDAPATDKDSCGYIPTESESALSKGEAIAKFNSIMAITGFDFGDSEIQFWRDRYMTSVSAEYVLKANGGKVNTGLYFSVQFDPAGNLIGASGSLAKVVDKGSFNTISAKAAVDRANDEKWAKFFAVGYFTGAMKSGVFNDDVATVGAPDNARGDAGASSDAASSSGAATEPVAPISEPSAISEIDPNTSGGSEPTSVPMPIATAEPEPLGGETPEPAKIREVTIDKVTSIWMQLMDSNGNTWIVPGFQLRSGEEYFSQIPSIEDGLIAF